MNDQIKYALIGAAIGGLAMWSFMTTASTTTNTSNTTRNRMMGTIDQHFIEQMIPHHEDAITMSQLAQSKAQRPEVKELANSIIDSQGKEIAQMRSWYSDWFTNDVPEGQQVMKNHGMMGNGSMHMGMMGDTSDITRLADAIDFDKAFVEEMIPHHQMAVMMATMLKNGTNRPEMEKLADDIIAAQTKEITMMRGWLTEWDK